MKTVEIIFSPTGGTEKVASIISHSWSSHSTVIDLTDPRKDFSLTSINKEDKVLIAMPSFGGRAPAIAIERLKKIKGNGAKCTLVVVYGNRAYEDTLIEMEDAAKECGFSIVAAISSVAEHSIIHEYAAGRPDKDDKKELISFAERIISKENGCPSIPGNRLYKKSGAGLVPKPTKECTKCSLCAQLCPVEAIDTKDFTADPKKCISCMRCVTKCPSGTRKPNGLMVSIAALAIKKACSVRKENELFI